MSFGAEPTPSPRPSGPYEWRTWLIALDYLNLCTLETYFPLQFSANRRDAVLAVLAGPRTRRARRRPPESRYDPDADRVGESRTPPWVRALRVGAWRCAIHLPLSAFTLGV